MNRSRVTLFALMWVLGVWFFRISGAEVEMKVSPGDNVTLYSDCIWKIGFTTFWFRNCSHDRQPPLIISAIDWKSGAHSRYSVVYNPSNQTHDLLVKNVSEADLGLYYCALQETQITEGKTGGGVLKAVYHYGNRATRLSLLDTTPIPSRINWKLLVSVCFGCVLLSSLLSSTCVYCKYHNRTKGVKNQDEREGHKKENRKSTKRDKVGGEDEVCYASLDLPSRGQKQLKMKKKKKRRVESSDFSTYSEVKTERL